LPRRLSLEEVKETSGTDLIDSNIEGDTIAEANGSLPKLIVRTTFLPSPLKQT
jgi:hypothetical protein